MSIDASFFQQILSFPYLLPREARHAKIPAAANESYNWRNGRRSLAGPTFHYPLEGQ